MARPVNRPASKAQPASGKIEIPYNFTPRPYQEKLFNCIAHGYKRAFVYWHRRAGKDKVLINIVVKEACKRVGIYYYFFPTYSQGRRIMWDGIGKDGFKFINHIPEALIEKKLDDEMKIVLTNGSIIQIIGTDNCDSIVGSNPVGCVFSEFAIQNPVAWELVRPILRENGGWAIFNTTPRGHGHADKLYVMACSNPEWFAELLTIEDTGVISKEDIERERKEGMPEELIQQEYYCSREAAQSMQLISYFIVKSAQDRKYMPQEYKNSKISVGLDVARGGADRSSICVRQGVKILEFMVFNERDTTILTDNMAGVLNKYNATGFIDAVGIGGPVYDRLKRLGFNVFGVVGGETAKNPKRYFNKRMEIWSRMKEWLEEVGEIPVNTELENDLMGPQYSFTTKFQEQLEKKEDMKKRGIRSPDLADSLALTFAIDVGYNVPITGNEQSEEYYEHENQNTNRSAVTGY